MTDVHLPLELLKSQYLGGAEPPLRLLAHPVQFMRICVRGCAAQVPGLIRS
jgi:hypothetical protein